MMYLAFTVWLVRKQIHRVKEENEEEEEKVLLTTKEGATEIREASSVTEDTIKVLV